MKLNIYVPDDLWGRASEAKPGSNPSQVVQDGLQRLVAASSAPARLAEVRPEGAEESLEKAAMRMLEEAKVEFSDGYAAGLRIGQAIPWSQLETFAVRGRCDLKRWAEPWASWITQWHALGAEEMRKFDIDAEEQPEYDQERRSPEELERAAAEHDRMVALLSSELGDLVDDYSFRHRPWAWIQGCQQALRELWERLTGPTGEHTTAANLGGHL